MRAEASADAAHPAARYGCHPAARYGRFVFYSSSSQLFIHSNSFTAIP
jgi:hypothetical protein